MNKLHWLRTQWMDPVPSVRVDESGTEEHFEVQFLRALRSDGQMFEVHADVGPIATPKNFRERLGGMLNDPALPYVANADDETRKQYVQMFKGSAGWIEEPGIEQENLP
jgi:hypothetical protein